MGRSPRLRGNMKPTLWDNQNPTTFGNEAELGRYVRQVWTPKKGIQKLIDKKSKTVLYLGYGVIQHRELALKYIEKMNVPVLLTWRAADLLPDDHPLYAGRPGSLAQPKANKILMEADVVLCIGARIDLETVAFDYYNFAPQAEITVVDIDQSELDKLPNNWKKICMDAGGFMGG